MEENYTLWKLKVCSILDMFFILVHFSPFFAILPQNFKRISQLTIQIKLFKLLATAKASVRGIFAGLCLEKRRKKMREEFLRGFTSKKGDIK
jgi:hypothetical protein